MRTCRAVVVVLMLGLVSPAATTSPSPEYHIYAGNTHSHTVFTWSHGDQWAAAKPGAGDANELGIVRRPDGSQSPGKNKTLKPDWQNHQGLPAKHYLIAKTNGYDFYVTSDHSQEAGFQPPSADNKQWVQTQREAADATDANFVALAGYEHSENNGPGLGKGHINVINSAEYLNALAPGVDMAYFYKWLKTAKPNGEGPVVASFNHPGPNQYDNWANCDPEIADVITMLEVINSNNHIHYEAFLNALDHGWKVSPVCGNDNHGFWGITHQTSRTFVLAADKTKVGILDAMKHRRTYASLDQNIQCRYTVNGQIMGSTLEGGEEFRFDISISDPDTKSPADQITKIAIMKDGGKLAAVYAPDSPAVGAPKPDWSVHWTPTIHDSSSHYFFICVWNAGGGDAPKADPAQPVAWLAPVWTGR